MSGVSDGVKGDRSYSSLPDEILSVIPTDPFEQLDLARKITSMAIASRVSNLEAEAIQLSKNIQERELDIHELEWKKSLLEKEFRDSDSRLKILLHENRNLKKERDSLAATVKNLSSDMAKLETFKKQVIQSLTSETVPQTEPIDIKTCDQSIFPSPCNDQRINMHSFHRSYSSKSANMDHGADKASKYKGPRLSVTPYISTSFTPTIISPQSNSTSGSPKRSTGAMSPSNTHDSESRKTYLRYSSSQQSSAANSPPRASTPLSDGKEFFRQVRNRLSCEQFRAFLANIKELNTQKQTREETLRKANEIFGIENKDLYMSFQGLVPKNKTYS